MQYKLPKELYSGKMSTYGERLKEAMAYRSAQIGRDVTRIELANAAGCSRQNIGMILTGAQGEDQKLSTERHAKAAAYLKVDADWLLEGKGSKNKNPPHAAQPSSEGFFTPIAAHRGGFFTSKR